MKVRYKGLWGGESTAYLDRENPVSEGVYDGTDKHSDIKVRIASMPTDDPERNEWVEIEKEL